MTDRLYAWNEDRLVGVFSRGADGTVSYEYEYDASCPLSLSLPLDGSWGASTPQRYLDNLLPEGEGARLRMGTALNVDWHDPFCLLAGVDAAGGYCFTLTDEAPVHVIPEMAIVGDGEIESQMRLVWESQSLWWEETGKARFSLAGTQGKFSLTKIGDVWFWPAMGLPSTHILKPDGRRLPRVSELEHATLHIASGIGISTEGSQTVCYGKQSGLLVRRFDRELSPSGIARRLPTEDFAQMLGLPPSSKYDAEFSDVVVALRRGGAADDEIYKWVRMVAFNNGIGGLDAHAKNYSLYLAEDGPKICPLYDANSLAPLPAFRDGVVGIGINDVYDPWDITLKDWRSQATACGLDADAVEEIVFEVESALVNFDYSSLPCSDDFKESISMAPEYYGRDLLPSLGIKSPSGSPQHCSSSLEDEMKAALELSNERRDDSGAILGDQKGRLSD